uniref:Solute carrier family 35 member F5 n=1 Tax=Acrobeloides nanus TaxID=290746 RepID=A0A914EJ56_9BILA
MVVNIVWVGSAEITRYIFIDLQFNRPLFITYVKSCMFSIFMLRYALSPAVETKNQSGKYSSLESHSEEDGEIESLTNAEFEAIPMSSDIDSEFERNSPLVVINGSLSPSSTKLRLEDSDASSTTPSKPSRKNSFGKRRKVRFALFREIRRIPSSIAEEAKKARLPYGYGNPIEGCMSSPFVRYVFYFAPLWFISSITYQAALAFTSVSAVNLISSSSSLFVLILNTLCPSRSSDRFTFTKLALVLLNFGGVAIVSEFSLSVIGAGLSLFSAFSYSLYLTTFSAVSAKHGDIDMNLMFGSIGLFSFFVCTPLMFIVHLTGIESQLPPPTHFFVCTPLMFIVHLTGIESQLPPPTQLELFLTLLSGFVGSVFADYLWIYATFLTNPLISSLALTLGIPVSMLADSFFRHNAPNIMQILASIPIMASFIGAALIMNKSEKGNNSKGSNLRSSIVKVMEKSDGGSYESQNLIENEESL